jgi:hypothetical protein
VIEDLPLTESLDATATAEGGLLGSGSINLSLREQTFRPPCVALPPPRPSLGPRAPKTPSVPRQLSPGDRYFACPIPGCGKVFIGTRGGWDAHVGAVRQHPSWLPDITSPERRRQLFKAQFPKFFEG